MGLPTRFRRVFLAAAPCLLGFGAGSIHAAHPAAVGIYAQTDSRAEFRPCHCPGAEQSGFARRAWVFKMGRAQRFPTVFLDGGDFVPAPEETLVVERAALMIETMSLMKYDAVAVGELELFLGRDYLARAAERLPLVCSNLRLLEGEAPEIPSTRWVEAGEERIAVVSFLDPLLFYSGADVFEHQAKDFLVMDPVEALAPLVEELRPRADLVVLLAHAAWPEIERVLGEVGGIDVVVAGHEPPDTVPAMEHDGVLVMVPGERSRQVAQLNLESPDGEAFAMQSARMWDLKELTRADSRVDALVQEFETLHGRQ